MPSKGQSRFTRSLAVGIAAAALAAPAAQAGPNLEPGSDPGPVAAAEPVPVETRASTTVIDEGFDWGSAAIGAGGAGAMILLGLGGAALVGGRRARVHGA